MRLLLLVFLISSSIFFQSCQPEPLTTRPNIILFYADDYGWTDGSTFGSDFYETPNLDRLATQSMRFINAYANAANCAPSRACLITGLYPPRHGIYTVNGSDRGRSETRRIIPAKNTKTLDPKFPTLPQTLQKAGYKTCMAGKWHLSDDPIPYGFDANFGGNHKGHPPTYFSPYKNPALPDGPEGEHLPDRLSRDVSNWITKNKEESFFVYFPFYSVHTPVQGREDLTQKYEGKEPGEYHNHTKHAAMIEAMDEAIGKVLKTVESLGLEKNTLIVFTADNGPAGRQSVAKPLRGTKGMYYEGGIREPFLVKWPGVVKPNTTNETPIIGLDLFPTFTEIAQTENPSMLDGVSLMPLFNGDTIENRSLFWHFPAYLEMGKKDRAFEESHDKPHFRTSPCSVIRKGNWKLIQYFERGDLELYDLENDISEAENLADTNPDKRDELMGELAKWQMMVKAPAIFEINPDFVVE